ncbi:hypothetical protein L249_7109 [Ophiocordyceps polyrhachis-furcata BCC 54312]|uniref:Uncharacterized protein n=1 Tax=Ophiocordyceps polyrhachis-furcata BCC 54312 TaxID=1330021 RepID=A0A367LKF7_9HYPO|nr:hypothetical protein L249_7109 [Ophiocordyceps polyrhachis-furcata BCC 54312]
MHLRSAKEAWDKLKDLYNPVSDHSGRVIAVIAGVMGLSRDSSSSSLLRDYLPDSLTLYPLLV